MESYALTQARMGALIMQAHENIKKRLLELCENMFQSYFAPKRKKGKQKLNGHLDSTSFFKDIKICQNF